MKKTVLFSLLSLFSLFTQAQNQFYHFWANNRLCNVDNSIAPLQYDNWDIYKTLNNEWNGTLDSTFCGGLNIVEKIDLSTIGTNETFFIRHQFDNNNKILLQPNGLFNAQFFGNVSNSSNLNLANNCNGGHCTSLLIGLEIPDSLGTGTTMRWHEIVPMIDTLGNIDISTCIPIEYFSNSYLRELLFKVTIQNSSGELFLSFLQIEEINFNLVSVQDSLIIPVNNQGQHEYYIPFATNLLMIKSDTSLYPSGFAQTIVRGRIKHV